MTTGEAKTKLGSSRILCAVILKAAGYDGGKERLRTDCPAYDQSAAVGPRNIRSETFGQ